MVIHRLFLYKYVKKTFEILRSEITFLIDLYRSKASLHFKGFIYSKRKISVSEHAFSSVICRDDAR